MLDELGQLERNATPGPWEAKGFRVRANPEQDEDGCISFDLPAICDCKEDAALIATARNALSALLRVARAAQWRQTCENCGGRGLVWHDLDGEAEAEACDCTIELTDALADL